MTKTNKIAEQNKSFTKRNLKSNIYQKLQSWAISIKISLYDLNKIKLCISK